MGGGGAIRAAARFGGGLGSAAAAIRRGAPSFNPATAARPVPAGMNSSPPSQDAERPFTEVDGWVLAGEEEETVGRVVFGPAATAEEAEEATSELKEALERVYLSSSDATGWIPSTVGWVSGFPALSDSEHSETKPCDTCQSAITDPAPNTALQAFKMLSESTTAQTVVASIACDENVWNAVLSNSALVDFLESQKKGAQAQITDMESVADSDPQYQESEDTANSGLSGLASVMEGIKVKVLEMVSNVSGVLQSVFGPSVPDHKEEGDGNGKFSTKDMGQAASLMGLAVLVIMVVLLKRA